MGGAQPLAITMAEGVCLAAEVESWRAAKRVETRYLDKVYENLDEGIDAALEACRRGEALSIGVIATAVDMLERLKERGIVPDVLTDQTSAHDPMVGYLPQGMGSDEAAALSHWWPAVRLWVRQPGHSRYSGVLEGLLRRAARMHAQGGWLDSGGPRKRRMPGIISGGGGGSSSHAALELRAPLLPLHDARRLVDACALYLPAVLPLLRPSDALALLHAYALATARTPAALGESTGPPEIAEIAISKLVDAASSWRRPPPRPLGS
jgi:hypothetical protein